MLVWIHILAPLAAVGVWALVTSGGSASIDLIGLLALAAGTLAMYCGERAWSPGPAVRQSNHRLMWLLAGLAAGGCLTALIVEPELILPATPAVIAGLSYPWARRIPLVKPLLVGIAWSCACGPLVNGGHWDAVLMTAKVLIVAGATILCDLKDAEIDATEHSSNLASKFGLGVASAIAAGLIICGSAAVLTTSVPSLAACLGVAALALFPSFLARPLAGPIAVDLSLCLPMVWWLLSP